MSKTSSPLSSFYHSSYRCWCRINTITGTATTTNVNKTINTLKRERILLIGDGDFSFAKKLTIHLNSHFPSDSPHDTSAHAFDHSLHHCTPLNERKIEDESIQQTEQQPSYSPSNAIASAASFYITATVRDSYEELIQRHKNAKANIQFLRKSGVRVLFGVDVFHLTQYKILLKDDQMKRVNQIRGLNDDRDDDDCDNGDVIAETEEENDEGKWRKRMENDDDGPPSFYDRIIFNHPHSGGKSFIEENRILLSSYLKNASKLLIPSPASCLMITLLNGQSGAPYDSARVYGDCWKLIEILHSNNLLLTYASSFPSQQFHFQATGHREKDSSIRSESSMWFECKLDRFALFNSYQQLVKNGWWNQIETIQPDDDSKGSTESLLHQLIQINLQHQIPASSFSSSQMMIRHSMSSISLFNKDNHVFQDLLECFLQFFKTTPISFASSIKESIIPFHNIECSSSDEFDAAIFSYFPSSSSSFLLYGSLLCLTNEIDVLRHRTTPIFTSTIDQMSVIPVNQQPDIEMDRKHSLQIQRKPIISTSFKTESGKNSLRKNETREEQRKRIKQQKEFDKLKQQQKGLMEDVHPSDNLMATCWYLPKAISISTDLSFPVRFDWPSDGFDCFYRSYLFIPIGHPEVLAFVQELLDFLLPDFESFVENKVDLVETDIGRWGISSHIFVKPMHSMTPTPISRDSFCVCRLGQFFSKKNQSQQGMLVEFSLDYLAMLKYRLNDIRLLHSIDERNWSLISASLSSCNSSLPCYYARSLQTACGNSPHLSLIPADVFSLFPPVFWRDMAFWMANSEKYITDLEKLISRQSAIIKHLCRILREIAGNSVLRVILRERYHHPSQKIAFTFRIIFHSADVSLSADFASKIPYIAIEKLCQLGLATERD